MAGDAGVRQAIDAVIDEAVEDGRVVGTVVFVRDQGKPVYARGAGYADREAGVPVALDTVFRWASLAKPLVAATALVLIDRESLAWMRDSAAKWLRRGRGEDAGLRSSS